MTVTNTPKGRKAVHTLIRRVWARRLSRAVELGKNDIKGSFRSISKDGYWYKEFLAKLHQFVFSPCPFSGVSPTLSLGRGHCSSPFPSVHSLDLPSCEIGRIPQLLLLSPGPQSLLVVEFSLVVEGGAGRRAGGLRDKAIFHHFPPKPYSCFMACVPTTWTS